MFGLKAIVYVLAAVTPAIILLIYVYRHDKVEKEPTGLLIRLLVQGVLSALFSMTLEEFGERVLGLFFYEDTAWYWILFAFLVVAVAEEGTKFLLMKRMTWRNPNFNFRFDGIIYAVFVSLGFAAFENIGYVFGYGLSVAPSRALLSIPGHMAFAVYMGYYYGRARWYDNYGYKEEANNSLWASFLSAVFYHGFYDACAMLGTTLSMIVFFIFVAITYYRAFRTIRKESQMDAPII